MRWFILIISVIRRAANYVYSEMKIHYLTVRLFHIVVCQKCAGCISTISDYSREMKKGQ